MNGTVIACFTFSQTTGLNLTKTNDTYNYASVSWVIIVPSIVICRMSGIEPALKPMLIYFQLNRKTPFKLKNQIQRKHWRSFCSSLKTFWCISLLKFAFNITAKHADLSIHQQKNILQYNLHWGSIWFLSSYKPCLPDHALPCHEARWPLNIVDVMVASDTSKDGMHSWLYGQFPLIDQFHKSQSAPAPYPTMRHSEQKCIHFCSEWGIVGYGKGAFWDFLIRSIGCEYEDKVDPFITIQFFQIVLSDAFIFERRKPDAQPYY